MSLDESTATSWSEGRDVGSAASIRGSNSFALLEVFTWRRHRGVFRAGRAPTVWPHVARNQCRRTVRMPRFDSRVAAAEGERLLALKELYVAALAAEGEIAPQARRNHVCAAVLVTDICRRVAMADSASGASPQAQLVLDRQAVELVEMGQASAQQRRSRDVAAALAQRQSQPPHLLLAITALQLDRLQHPRATTAHSTLVIARPAGPSWPNDGHLFTRMVPNLQAARQTLGSAAVPGHITQPRPDPTWQQRPPVPLARAGAPSATKYTSPCASCHARQHRPALSSGLIWPCVG
eukprot:scaffold603_cov404-Prasinococcus_capsulatus_cf.AAC.6